MQQHLLYVLSPSQWEKTKIAMERLGATKKNKASDVAINYTLQHRLLGQFNLHISILTDLDGVIPHMRQNPVDILIFDERGEDWLNAATAISQIKTDVRQLGDLWGPDFYFPMSRVVAILKEESRHSHRSFDLGRLQVRDVLVGPENTAAVLRWLREVLSRGILREKNRVGVALSGGGLEGFLYQLGVIYALEVALKNRTLLDSDIVSGISSGAIAGSLIGSRANILEVIRAFYGMSTIYPQFSSQNLFDIAGSHIIQRWAREIMTWGLRPSRWAAKTLRTIPTGFFKGNLLEGYFHAVIKTASGHDQFEKLDKELYIGATDQDSYEHVTFGLKPHDKVAISEALRASCAFPPLFAPKTIQGRRYIDGQVTKSCNLEIIVERGARLMFVIDPLKPFTTARAGAIDEEGGLFGTIQTIKALVSTRFEQSLLHISSQYPDVDFLVFQPDEECAKLMAGSPMRYRIRTQLIEAAYRGTLRRLRERYVVYSVKMGRYGFNLRAPEKLKELENNYDEIFKSAVQRHSG